MGLIFRGEVAEWLKAAVLKTAEVSNTSVGSNPTLTANARNAANDSSAGTDGTDHRHTPAQERAKRPAEGPAGATAPPFSPQPA